MGSSTFSGVPASERRTVLMLSRDVHNVYTEDCVCVCVCSCADTCDSALGPCCRWGQGRTIARDAREGDIEVDDQLLSSRLVDDDGRFQMNAAVVEKLDGGQGEDQEQADQGYCRPVRSFPSQLFNWLLGNVVDVPSNLHKPPDPVLILTSSRVCESGKARWVSRSGSRPRVCLGRPLSLRLQRVFLKLDEPCRKRPLLRSCQNCLLCP